MSQPVLTLTPAAADRVKQLLSTRGKPSLGIRVGIRMKGCSGNAYTIEFADEVGPYDEKIESHGVTVLVDPKAVMFILGSEMDFVEDKLSSGFVFNNPNAKGTCGCGESFHV